jgi:ribonuclease BN (tRNA processing enzyme)
MPLEVQLLPTAPGDRSQTQPLTTFVINGRLAIDAGSLGLALSGDQLANIHHVIITHSHLDHIASLPIAIAEVFPKLKKPMRVYGTSDVLKAVQDHLLNDVIWPDFARIKMLAGDQMAMEFIPIRPKEPFDVEGLRITPVWVSHAVPTVGLIVEAPDVTVAFTSDTSSTDEIWAEANRRPNLQAVFIDCSFPDEFEQLAIQSGHLTPKLVAREAAKLTTPARIMCVHIKPDTRAKVLAQLIPHRTRRMTAVELGKTYTFNGVPLPNPAR